MKLIALEEHFVTPEIVAAWKALPKDLQDVSSVFSSGKVQEQLLSMESAELRLRKMDETGIDVQVLSLTTPGTQNLEPADAVRLARDANDLAARTIRQHPTRFQGFATLPTPDPKAAAEELRRCVEEHGFKGALLCGRTRERPLDHADFFPIYAEAARLNVPLYIHPQSPVPAVREAYYSGFDEKVSAIFATAAWGWHMETGVQVLRFILAGIFDRLPHLQLILGHWGEMIVFFLDRINERFSQATTLQRSVADYVRQNLYVTPSGIYAQPYLEECVRVMGIDRILFALDAPYIDAPNGGSRRFLTESRLSVEDQEKVAQGNWERLVGA